MEPLGTKLRRQRRRLGLTLDELAGRSGISKPYLSLIETGRVGNPPSDEKLRRLEQTLGFTSGELLSQAHLQRTPRDVRVMLQQLMGKRGPGARGEGQENAVSPLAPRPLPLDLDDAYLSGVLQELVGQSSGNLETIRTNAVPVINRVSAGYPKDFTDMSYPKGAADDYVGCPDVQDKNAFGARVHGDSMQPKYREGDIIIFSPAIAPRNGDDCFVRFADGQTTFKRVFFESNEDGTPVLRLQPRNEKYRPQIVPAEQISGLYKAVYRYEPVRGD
ncbi:MAG TPA: XRE family transcriptional regulator [Tepidisphaeraceae bacterium]|nr:XRE family transcriptional regulator [Tepidisphaeraceae bacterium]